MDECVEGRETGMEGGWEGGGGCNVCAGRAGAPGDAYRGEDK